MANLTMRVEDKLKQDFMTIAKLEGETATQVLVDYMKIYIKQKLSENGLYSLYLLPDNMTDDEANDINTSLQSMTAEEQKIGSTEIFKL